MQELKAAIVTLSSFLQHAQLWGQGSGLAVAGCMPEESNTPADERPADQCQQTTGLPRCLEHLHLTEILHGS